MKRIATLLVSLVPLIVGAQTIYRWTDARGETHYSDDLSSIPQRAKVTTTEGAELSVVDGERQPLAVKRVSAQQPVTPPARPMPPTGPFSLEIHEVVQNVDRAEVEFIREAAAKAVAGASWSPFGTLHGTVQMEISPRSAMASHFGGDAFGLAWGYSNIRVIAPDGKQRRGSRPQPYEWTVTHELTHLLQNQLSGGAGAPSWFTEGFARYVTGGEQYYQLTDVAFWVIKHEGLHPLDLAFTSRDCEINLAYQVGSQAIAFLISKVGVDGVKALFDLQRSGKPFAAAFESASSMTPEAFERAYIESLRPNFYERAK